MDDPYVAERLHAVAYGVVCRLEAHESVAALASDVYERLLQSVRRHSFS